MAGTASTEQSGQTISVEVKTRPDRQCRSVHEVNGSVSYQRTAMGDSEKAIRFDTYLRPCRNVACWKDWSATA
jgi:hypothetical protein